MSGESPEYQPVNTTASEKDVYSIVREDGIEIIVSKPAKAIFTAETLTPEVRQLQMQRLTLFALSSAGICEASQINLIASLVMELHIEEFKERFQANLPEHFDYGFIKPTGELPLMSHMGHENFILPHNATGVLKQRIGTWDTGIVLTGPYTGCIASLKHTGVNKDTHYLNINRVFVNMPTREFLSMYRPYNLARKGGLKTPLTPQEEEQREFMRQRIDEQLNPHITVRDAVIDLCTKLGLPVDVEMFNSIAYQPFLSAEYKKRLNSQILYSDYEALEKFLKSLATANIR